MDDRYGSKVLQWTAWRDARPDGDELVRWERAASHLHQRFEKAQGRGSRSELCHRLSVVNARMGRYDEALDWAEVGLNEGAEGWIPRLTEDKAMALYLTGREVEARALLEGLGPDTDHGRAEDPWKDGPGLTCPYCSAGMDYGERWCPMCQAEVDESFDIGRADPGDSAPRPTEYHRIKKFSIWLTDYTVDYDDPKNFLTAHRIRFLGEEAVHVTERERYVSLGRLSQGLLYFFCALWVWAAATMAENSIWPLVLIVSLMMATVVPSTIVYLYIAYPGFLGGTHQVDVKYLVK